MILILSNDTDQSTNDVIDWLIFYNANFKRINFSDSLRVNKACIDGSISFELELIKTGEIIHSNDISFFWYRRGDLNIYLDSDIQETDYISREQERLKQFIYHFLVKKVPSIGNYYDNDINKLIVLSLAADLGISVPKTLVTTNKNELGEFLKNNGEVITKAIDNSLNLTSLVNHNAFTNSEDEFFYSLFQVCVSKFIELRIFFLQNQFWATAIFSQNDEQTKVDFRNYNYSKPNRMSPYQLPLWLIKKLTLLNNRLGLTSGSIDMILSTEGDYILLEINPIGQFRNFSYFSNYNLEQKIARYIIDHEKEITPIQLY